MAHLPKHTAAWSQQKSTSKSCPKLFYLICFAWWMYLFNWLNESNAVVLSGNKQGKQNNYTKKALYFANLIPDIAWVTHYFFILSASLVTNLLLPYWALFKGCRFSFPLYKNVYSSFVQCICSCTAQGFLLSFWFKSSKAVNSCRNYTRISSVWLDRKWKLILLVRGYELWSSFISKKYSPWGYMRLINEYVVLLHMHLTLGSCKYMSEYCGWLQARYRDNLLVSWILWLYGQCIKTCISSLYADF